MVEFAKHDAATAPEGSKALIERSQKRFGRLPNLHATLAESPETYDAYLHLSESFGKSSFTPAERHVAMLAINVENRCHYCVPAHSGLALKDGVAQEVVDALRADRPIADAKLEALRVFAKSITVNRGEVAEAEVEAFLAAGFTRRNVFEVVLAVAYKTISNYVNHLAKTEVDPPFAKFAWAGPASE